MSEASDKKDYTAPEGATSDHSFPLGDRKYTATADWLILRKREKPVAEMFYASYVEQHQAPEGRPITFVFNGGPGAASAYLHMGALGPKRVVFNSDGTAPPPPARIVDNEESWIGFTDLVFIDPVGTGFSRRIEQEDKEEDDESKASEKDKEFYALKRDLNSLGEFISKYLSLTGRWESPVYIAGESYGGFRVAKLARLLQEGFGVGLSAAIMLSPALEFTLLDSSDYDVLPWVDVFPTMAAAAAAHGKLSAVKEAENLPKVMAAAEDFATSDLTRLLTRGNALSDGARKQIVNKASRFTGLDSEDIDRAGGRIGPRFFARNLLKEEGLVCGMYDASITARDPYPDRPTQQGPDPTLFAIERVFTGAVNAQLRRHLNLKTERDYHLLSREVNEGWKIDIDRHALQSQIGATDDLRYAMALNPHMKVWVSHGHFDLVTPYYSSDRLANLLKLPPEAEKNLTLRHYEGGHMFYTWATSRKAFTDDIRELYLAEGS
jgi:carboxypeptidase C (cathepsin A)